MPLDSPQFRNPFSKTDHPYQELASETGSIQERRASAPDTTDSATLSASRSVPNRGWTFPPAGSREFLKHHLVPDRYLSDAQDVRRNSYASGSLDRALAGSRIPQPFKGIRAMYNNYAGKGDTAEVAMLKVMFRLAIFPVAFPAKRVGVGMATPGVPTYEPFRLLGRGIGAAQQKVQDHRMQAALSKEMMAQAESARQAQEAQRVALTQFVAGLSPAQVEELAAIQAALHPVEGAAPYDADQFADRVAAFARGLNEGQLAFLRTLIPVDAVE